ncbi:MAG TPA: carbonic anhydrase [Bacillota bacterium]|nr:carbonic anhydrase [Bacillota bacterium]
MDLEKLLAYNQTFVAKEGYKPYETDSLPNKKMVVLTCMESRLVELLPKALNLHNGDVKMLKNAGAILRRPFDNMTKSILIAIHNLQAETVLIIGHYDCGMSKVNADELKENMINKGIKKETIQLLEQSGIHFEEEFAGFDTVEESIEQSVHILRSHPLLPRFVKVHGLAMDPSTGKVDIISEDK